MEMPNRRIILGALGQFSAAAAALPLLGAGRAVAAYPERPVKILVPQPAADRGALSLTNITLHREEIGSWRGTKQWRKQRPGTRR